MSDRSAVTRRPRGNERASELDHGTHERGRHSGGLVLEETMTAWVRRARARYECLLDLLLERGELGEGDDARRRYAAGLWLRSLYQRTHGARLTTSYDGLGRDQSEMSDAQARAHALYRRTLLAMGPEMGVLRQACGEDRAMRPALLRRALDRLAEWRGL